ncbi:MAG: carboxypeptidase regulatory-like domain-containing protein [Planctomycetaceae bacterium]|nr:carboxypeptidase regulatory-like domain-containing protein [Planctomycetaceae bacterium]
MPAMTSLCRFQGIRISHLTLAAVLLAAGCGGGPEGPELYEAQGTVTMDGQPLPKANLIFKPSEGPVATATTDAQGQFTLTTGTSPGAVAGSHQVAITVSAEGPDRSQMTPDDLVAMSMEKEDKPPESPIPVKYGDFMQSGLTATVDADPTKNNFEFKLTK